jgi:phosphate transport system permease protein
MIRGREPYVQTSLILLILAVAGAIAFLAGIAKARGQVGGEVSKLHSRLGYYGTFLTIATVLPALLLTLAWAGGEHKLINTIVATALPANPETADSVGRSLAMGVVDAVADGLPLLSADEMQTVKRVAYGFSIPADVKDLLGRKGVPLGSAPEPFIIKAALDTVDYRLLSRKLITGLALLCALAGFAWGFARIEPRFRARNVVEGVLRGWLLSASTIAVLTTVGIVMSVLFESIHFFKLVPIQDFLLGTVWDPRFTSAGRTGGGDGQFGLLPLLWGTLFISLVALAVAVPVGLFAAIYMAEYAAPRVRAVVKPLLEVLAGIPTIVYGFFALITFGPFLRDVGEQVGIAISATSVATAGIVMGIMIIPFVSSLSDDIISAIPQSLREGSYGLGATRSETIKLVILPAALPGIVGAILLAASRAIGETMIVVLAAGIAANLTINPLEPVTTITVKIVSQLTGDLEFNSPQTLVAFALGLTLFLITLALNVYALYLVRKYREQYE